VRATAARPGKPRRREWNRRWHSTCPARHTRLHLPRRRSSDRPPGSEISGNLWLGNAATLLEAEYESTRFSPGSQHPRGYAPGPADALSRALSNCRSARRQLDETLSQERQSKRGTPTGASHDISCKLPSRRAGITPRTGNEIFRGCRWAVTNDPDEASAQQQGKRILHGTTREPSSGSHAAMAGANAATLGSPRLCPQVQVNEKCCRAAVMSCEVAHEDIHHVMVKTQVRSHAHILL